MTSLFYFFQKWTCISGPTFNFKFIQQLLRYFSLDHICFYTARMPKMYKVKEARKCQYWFEKRSLCVQSCQVKPNNAFVFVEMQVKFHVKLSTKTALPLSEWTALPAVSVFFESQEKTKQAPQRRLLPDKTCTINSLYLWLWYENRTFLIQENTNTTILGATLDKPFIKVW